jgi:hypothetical protein
MNTLLAGISGKHTVSRFPRLATLLAILLLAGATTFAHADCGIPKQLLMSGASKAASNSALKASSNTALAASTLQQQVSNSDSRDSADNHGKEPIVGLWRITVTDDSGNVADRVISGWTSDGLEFDQDISPILTGYVCYGTWEKLGHNTYGLTHPFFSFQDVNSNGEGSETTLGQWDGNSAYFDYKVKVAKNGKTFTGKTVVKFVQGPDPYDPGATVLFTGTFDLSATKLGVDKSLLP